MTNQMTSDKLAVPTVLVISALSTQSTTKGCIVVPPEAVDWALVARHEPGLIISPLMMGRIDVLDIAQTLAELGFRGKYRVVANDLPDPGIVLRDIRRTVPGLDFGIWPLDGPETGDQDCRSLDCSELRKFAALAR